MREPPNNRIEQTNGGLHSMTPFAAHPGVMPTRGELSMFKVVFLVHKKAGMDHGDFRRHWRETQGSLASKIPGIRKYVQNHTTATPDGSAPPYDGYAEVWFDSEEAFKLGMASPEAQAAIADLPNFLDAERMHSFIVEEVEVV